MVESQPISSGRKNSKSENIYSPILDFIADNKEHSIGDILEAVQDKGIYRNQVVEASITLGHFS
jgi:hypothetical protein